MPGHAPATSHSAWQRELELRGAYGYESDFPAALKFAGRLRPGRLSTRLATCATSRPRWSTRRAPHAAAA